MDPRHLWIDGVVVPAEGLHLSAFDRGFQLGDGIFETLRARAGHVTELPEHLVVVGSGVTGAEFAGAYDAMGSQVTLVSSRDRVLPAEDSGTAAIAEAQQREVLRRRDELIANPALAGKFDDGYFDRLRKMVADVRSGKASAG